MRDIRLVLYVQQTVVPGVAGERFGSDRVEGISSSFVEETVVCSVLMALCWKISMSTWVIYTMYFERKPLLVYGLEREQPSAFSACRLSRRCQREFCWIESPSGTG